MLSAQSSITDGICRMLVRNNEGNRKTQQKQTNNSQHREAWVIDSISEFRCWKTILKPMFLVILRLRTNERLLRTRVFMTLDFYCFCEMCPQTRTFSNFAAPAFLEILPQTRENTYTQTDHTTKHNRRRAPFSNRIAHTLHRRIYRLVNPSTLQPFNPLITRPSPINQNPNSQRSFHSHGFTRFEHTCKRGHQQSLYHHNSRIQAPPLRIARMRLGLPSPPC